MIKNIFETRNKKNLEDSFFKVYYPILLECEKNDMKMIDIEYFINFSEKILFENYYLTHYHTIKMFKKLKENIHSENARKILYEYVDDIKTHYNYCAQKLGFPSSSNLHKTNYLYRSLFDLPFIFYVMFISIIIVFLLLFIYILIIFLESGLLKGTINF